MRKFALKRGLQLIHIEILEYLSMCNRYSDTTQTLSLYLGQTKGSISQSLKFLEEENFVKKTQDKTDKRVFHLSLMAKGSAAIVDFHSAFSFKGQGAEHENLFKFHLFELQKKHGLKSFGVCATCKFNQSLSKDKFQCGLTEESLSFEDLQKICREHESK